MAFQKTIALPSGVSGNYIRISAFRWDRSAREASVLFALYKDATTAASGQPLVPIVAKLRLEGDKFDEYLGNAALVGADDVLARLYAAAVVEPVVSDHGADLFRDALGDVAGEPFEGDNERAIDTATFDQGGEIDPAARFVEPDAPEVIVPVPSAPRSVFQRALDFFAGRGYGD